MVAFKTALDKAMNRLSGGIFGWFANASEQSDRMTADRALHYAPVWNCVATISGAFMIMPLNLHRKTGREIKQQTKHAAYKLLRWRPNAYQTPSQWKRQMMCHALLWGNMRSFIRRERGIPMELIPLLPDRTASIIVQGMKYHVTLVERDDRLALWEDMEQNMEKTVVMPDSDVWHVPGLGFDGIEGKSLIRLAAQSWGVGIGAETHIASQQKKGYAGGLMLEAPVGTLREQGKAEEFLTKFREQHEGGDNAGKVGLLREGIKASVLAMNNADAQFIEQRRFQREDAALWFLLQGILGDSSRASYNSLEQKNLAYRINCLAPWTTAMEEESDLKLLTDSERDREFYFKFNDGALLRTEKSATMAFISQGIAARVLNANEGRAMFDMNPYEGGDVYENPAVTVKEESASKEEPEDDDSEDPASQPANRARLEHLIGLEAAKVLDAAQQATDKGKNFLQWVDNFYDDKWQQKFASWLAEMKIDQDYAAIHCGESKDQLLAVCDISQPENLVENVKKCVETWKSRVNSIGKAK